jgi:radical SAM superfamily enzyme YgiQ (UPF0313 family)
VDPPENVATITKLDGIKQFGSLITDIPLGIISLSAYAKKHHDVSTMVIDFNVLLNQSEDFKYSDFLSYFDDNLRQEKYITFDPDIVGTSALFTSAYDSIIDLANLTKVIFPKTINIVGGNLPTSMYREILSDSPYVDAVCFGEGEKPLIDLLEATNLPEFLESHPSWVTHQNIEDKISTYRHDFIENLDEIPFLDYDILDLPGYKLNPTTSRYSVTESYMAKNGGNELLLEKAAGKDTSNSGDTVKNSMPIMTSRGCPFLCTFCASHAAHGRKMRYNSVERVSEDLRLMIKKYGVDAIIVQDDHFMGGKRRPYEMVSKINELNLGMFFQNALAIYALDKEFLTLLKSGGVDELVLPIESGSARVLKKLMKKPLKLDLVREVTKNCREASIYTDCNIVLGMPGETKEDIQEAREFLKSVYGDWFRIFVATPIPGSEMYDTCETNDYFKVPPKKGNYKRAIVETEYLTPEYVQYMTYYMNIELNFVYNSNIRLGNYDIALESFLNVLGVKPDHAIAHYYVSYCHKKMGQIAQADVSYAKAQEIVSSTDFWDSYIQDFNIPIEKNSLSYAS